MSEEPVEDLLGIPPPDPHAARSSTSAVVRRYRDAFLAVKGLEALGTVVKIVGAGAGIFGILFGLGEIKNFVGIFAVILAGVGGSIIFALGVVIAAFGQLVRAALDTAVNTSPLLSMDDRRALLRLQPDAAPAPVDGSAPRAP